MQEKSLKGKTALVTGAAKRIGREIALHLARAGVNVIVHYNQSEDQAVELCHELAQLNVQSWPLKANFEIQSEYETLVDRAINLAGQIDFLINSASVFPSENLNTVTFESVVSNFQINAWAPFVLCNKFSEHTHDGKIINLLDSRIKGQDWNHVGYILSKHMLTILTEMLALKYAPQLTVNGIAPGMILPPPGQPESYLEEMVSTVPLKRHGDPFDIAEAVIYLLKTRFITGNIIYIDGGRHLKEDDNG